MNQLIIEVFKENEVVDVRELPANDKRAAMKLYSQVAYAHTGGKFPVEFRLPLEEGQPAYTEGKYYFTQDSFKVGQFDRLEFDRNLKLVPVNQAQLSKVS
ncbi:single-stranded DNA-binding protein [Vibrio algivorus]|uniref:Single-stranded DNA-binding protein n=1 Tax=Vibrio algivorus TaxID=1667024 RepID=A0ABQ6ELL9_9VIBR|nr:single-stranded DNA-binding protein [Vibrio algivorus]GLT14047.1 hypothetical protein GCM10007931_10210 [Vibrio algivorus]